MKTCRHPGVVLRPIMCCDEVTLTTYVLRREGNNSEQLQRFILRLNTSSSTPIA